MLSLQELLPHIELLESGERLPIGGVPIPYSVALVSAETSDREPRRSASARLIRVGWVTRTVADRMVTVYGSEAILVGPGEDVEVAGMAFCLERAGELLEAHPPGAVAIVSGELPCLNGASEELANSLLVAIGRSRACGGMLLGVVPHPCPELFQEWLTPGERSPWSRVDSRMFCYANVDGRVLRLEAYDLDPRQQDRVVAIATTPFQAGFSVRPESTQGQATC